MDYQTGTLLGRLSGPGFPLNKCLYCICLSLVVYEVSRRNRVTSMLVKEEIIPPRFEEELVFPYSHVFVGMLEKNVSLPIVGPKELSINTPTSWFIDPFTNFGKTPSIQCLLQPYVHAGFSHSCISQVQLA